MRVLCLGDVVARPGRLAVAEKLDELKKEHDIHFVIVNGENSAGGSGIDKKCYQELCAAGADIITLGDHTWRRPEVKQLLAADDTCCIAPANYPPKSGTRGYLIREVQGISVGVANILGRTFLSASLDCPFRKMEELLDGEFGKAQIRIVDLHGEATSEKIAFAKHFDGKLSLVFGTHTHVQTADEEILPGGTARITDIGMCGSHGGVIGMDEETAIQRFITGRPSTYKASEGNARVMGIVSEIDEQTGRATEIRRIALSV